MATEREPIEPKGIIDFFFVAGSAGAVLVGAVLADAELVGVVVEGVEDAASVATAPLPSGASSAAGSADLEELEPEEAEEAEMAAVDAAITSLGGDIIDGMNEPRLVPFLALAVADGVESEGGGNAEAASSFSSAPPSVPASRSALEEEGVRSPSALSSPSSPFFFLPVITCAHIDSNVNLRERAGREGG